eukprot:1045113-Amorphochlora_amoeboformis.AAC.1
MNLGQLVHPEKDVEAREIDVNKLKFLQHSLVKDVSKEIEMHVLFRKSAATWGGHAPKDLRSLLIEKVTQDTLIDESGWKGEVISGAHRRRACDHLHKEFPKNERFCVFKCYVYFIEDRETEISGAHRFGKNLNYLEEVRITSSFFQVLKTVRTQWR